VSLGSVNNGGARILKCDRVASEDACSSITYSVDDLPNRPPFLVEVFL
jgi:hypothetical protein